MKLFETVYTYENLSTRRTPLSLFMNCDHEQNHASDTNTICECANTFRSADRPTNPQNTTYTPSRKSGAFGYAVAGVDVGMRCVCDTIGLITSLVCFFFAGFRVDVTKRSVHSTDANVNHKRYVKHGSPTDCCNSKCPRALCPQLCRLSTYLFAINEHHRRRRRRRRHHLDAAVLSVTITVRARVIFNSHRILIAAHSRRMSRMCGTYKYMRCTIISSVLDLGLPPIHITDEIMMSGANVWNSTTFGKRR